MPVTTGNYPTGFFSRDAQLGYVIRPGASATLRRSLHGETLFAVTYKATKNGYRVTRGNPDGPTWLFAGCSYTFGEGLNDSETLPSQVSKDLGYAANVINLGVPGHGPHQMLRELEISQLPGVKLPVKHVIFQTIFAHVRRSAGRARWDLTGPRYVLSGDTVAYAGPFHGSLVANIVLAMSRSAALRFFMDRGYFGEQFSDRDLEIYGRIIERSARLAQSRLGADFTLIFWDEDVPLANRTLARLRKTGLPIILASSVMPRSELNRYRFPIDRHPRPEANVLLGRYVAAALGHSE